MGIIDTLSEGFNKVTRRLWLVLIPVALDIGIWIGPRLSISNLSQQALTALSDVSELGAQYQQQLEVARQWVAELGAQANVLSVLSIRMWGLPSLTGVIAPKATLPWAAQSAVQIPSWSSLAGLVVLLGLVSLLIACFFLALVAQQALEEPVDIGRALRIARRSWARLTALICVALLTLGAVTSGGVMVLSLLIALSPQLGELMLTLFQLSMAWFGVYASIIFFFTMRAMVLDDTGILRSVWSSLNIVHRNILSAFGFIILTVVIEMGLLYIWRGLDVNAAGALIGIVGNAYIGTGLVMASFIFYRDRFVAWQEAAAQAKVGEKRP